MNATPFDTVIFEKSKSHGVDPCLIKAVIAAESNFNPNALRNEPQIQDASRGLMQVLFATAQQMGYSGAPEGLFDPETNIEYGTRYLKWQLHRYNGQTPFAVAAYNSGTARRRPDGRFINYAYVDRVLGFYDRCKNAKQVESQANTFQRADRPPAANAAAPIRFYGAVAPDGSREASVETFIPESAVPWIVALAGMSLLALLGGGRSERD